MPMVGYFFFMTANFSSFVSLRTSSSGDVGGLYELSLSVSPSLFTALRLKGGFDDELLLLQLLLALLLLSSSAETFLKFK